MTKTISLDGTWEFLHTSPDRAAHPVQVRQIQVPGPWQAQFDDLRMKAGIGIYRRMVDVPAGWRQGRVFLRFGAVFHHSKAWVNGVPVGEHHGGFLPFSFDVTEQLNEGRNEIKVRAESPTDNPIAFPEAPFAEIPFGKQSWYGPLSGIWQPVCLEWRDVDHIARLKLVSDLSKGRVDVTAFFHTALTRSAQLEFTIHGPSGEAVARLALEAPAQTDEMSAYLNVRDILPWSPDEPNLYTLTSAIIRRGEVVDEVKRNFGFRSIETRNGRFYLNGKPLYLRAALDQDYYPDTICTVPSVEFLEDQFRKAKELGLNCLRCHIKAADPRYYDVADRLGLLIWTELPNGGLSTERSRSRKEALLKGIVDRDRHHPSIVIWTIINENWGTDLVHDPDHRAWLKRTYHWLKTYDPTRLVVDNSPLHPSFHVQTDIADYHFYAAIPDSHEAWDLWVNDLASRPAWLYTPEGDAIMTGQEPLMCSEFGNWGLPDPDDLADANGKEPWWFETGHDWGEGVMYAHGVKNRFTDWSLDRVFGTMRRFAEAAQWQQFRALKYEIESMRRRPELAGYVITEFTDAHWESNGLLDMRRNTRVFHDVFPSVNGDTVILPRPDKRSYWGGDTARIDLGLAHGAGERLENAFIEVTLGSHSETVPVPVPVPVAEPGSVVGLGELALQLARPSKPEMTRVEFKLRAANGETITSNTLDLALFCALGQDGQRGMKAWCPDPAIQERLDALGYARAAELEEADFALTQHHDAAIPAYVRGGGRLVFLPDHELQLYPFFPHWQNVRVVQRQGTLWQGDWASSFSWIDRSGPFSGLPGGPMVDLTFERVIPRHVISGCNLLDFQARVHSGLVVGWIHKPVALIVERAYGKGRMVASTFRLFNDPVLADPAATVLLDRLIELATKATTAAEKAAQEVDFDAPEDDRVVPLLRSSG